MLPATTKTKAIINWSPKQIATDVLFHAVYTCVAGLVYDSMNKAETPIATAVFAVLTAVALLLRR